MLGTVIFPVEKVISQDIKMIVQRLSFRAAQGKLRVISVWRCLAKSGAKVYRWSISVDRITGVESMTVDLVEAGPLCTADIADMFIEAPLELSVTLFHLTVVSNPATHRHEKEDAHETADSFPIARPHPKLTVVTDITHHIARSGQD
ncbi:hypothetical protein WJ32_24735 [Burkholderia ubonensis]|uniref:Uncharacterized protein n=1 Tax=Burkholderia ubonensis TaxID=101571 RepID=A0A103QZ00_9BURK|nr:hypothetical protein [Burkholderia ubonensis]AOJ65660.1 hypothetical protein WJ32_24735 [Burkholderia ubonensis]KVG58162.1 hypothetical protein WJ33_34480 [Burkholderia ubonensis]